MTRLRLLSVTVILLIPAAALAQTPSAPRAKTERGAIYLNGGYQAGTADVQDTVNFTSSAETGTFTWKFPVKPGAALDAGGRVRVWKRLSIGVAVTRFQANGTATVTALIPHPFFFKTPRTVEGTASIERQETAVHLRAVFASAPGRKLQFTGVVGPAFFTVKQNLVDKVNYSEAYPFDSATFTSATTRSVSKSKTGLGVGADVAYYFQKNLGVGLSASFAKVTFDLKASDDSTASVSAGGAIIGLGVRIRF